MKRNDKNIIKYTKTTKLIRVLIVIFQRKVSTFINCEAISVLFLLLKNKKNAEENKKYIFVLIRQRVHTVSVIQKHLLIMKRGEEGSCCEYLAKSIVIRNVFFFIIFLEILRWCTRRFQNIKIKHTFFF